MNDRICMAIIQKIRNHPNQDRAHEVVRDLIARISATVSKALGDIFKGWKQAAAAKFIQNRAAVFFVHGRRSVRIYSTGDSPVISSPGIISPLGGSAGHTIQRKGNGFFILPEYTPPSPSAVFLWWWMDKAGNPGAAF